MRCAYLAQDRADISEAIKSKPRTGHMCGKVLERSAKEGHNSTLHKNGAKHIWKSMWTVIGQETL